MKSSQAAGAGAGAAALVALVGIQLRTVIVGVPPVLPEIRDELHLTLVAAGALAAVPVLCLGAAAIPGAFLVHRFGARAVVGLGTVGLGAAALLRLAPPEPAALYVFSAAMALSVAIAQPGIAVHVRRVFPGQVQRMGALYSTSLSVGGLLGSALSVHLLALGGWRGTFVFWAVPALLVGMIWLALAPGRGAGAVSPHPVGLTHLVREPAVWRTAALFGLQSLVFYGSTTWIPFQLRPLGPGYLSLVLLVLNLASLPVAVTLVALPRPWSTSRLFYAGAGVMMAVGTAGFGLGQTGLALLWAALISVSVGMTFSGSNVLPALLARRPGDVAGFAALVLTVGYAISFLGPLMGGILAQQTHTLTSPFWLMTAAGAGVLVLGLTMPRRRQAEAVSNTTAVP